MPGGVQLLLDCCEFVLLAGGMAALYHYVPNTHVRWRHAWPAACSSPPASSWPRSVLAWYLAQVPTYSVVYGAFATRADPAGVDLRGLGDRAAGRGDRRLPAQPADARGALADAPGLALRAGGGGAARTDARARGAGQRA